MVATSNSRRAFAPFAVYLSWAQQQFGLLRLRVYLFLSQPASSQTLAAASGTVASTNYLAPVETDVNVRYFRFGLPFVLKCTPRGVSTEADALKFLNLHLPDLPIPRLLDVITVSETVYAESDAQSDNGDIAEDNGDSGPATSTYTYTLLQRIPGIRMSQLLDSAPDSLPDADVAQIVRDVRAVIDRLWSISRGPLAAPEASPPDQAERTPFGPSGLGTRDGTGVMLSASGHGLPDPLRFHAASEDALAGPFDSTLACYAYMAGTDSVEGLLHSLAHPATYPFPAPDANVHDPAEAMRMLADDPVVWVHTDLRLQNVLVLRDRTTGRWRLSGIVDWQDSGWLPRHWQLHILRRPHWGCRGAWLRIWLGAELVGPAAADGVSESESEIRAIQEVGRFDASVERAYEVSKRLLVYPL
jgi:hypothetical protein